MLDLPRPKVRALLKNFLRTDAEVDRFLVDYFPDIAQNRSAGMIREAKFTLLIESVDVDIIMEKLESFRSITPPLRGKKAKSSSARSSSSQSSKKTTKSSSASLSKRKKKAIADCVGNLDDLEIEAGLMIESSELRAWARDTRLILEKCLPGHHITEEFSRVGPYATHKNVEELRKLLARAEKAVVHDGLLSKIDSKAQTDATTKTELTITDARRQHSSHPYTFPRPKKGSLR